MSNKLNVYAFALSLISILFLFLISFTGIFTIIDGILPFHPLTIVLVMAVISFFIGMMGFTGARSWKSYLRSMFTVLISLGLSILLVIILGIGNLLG
ncbi:hypothetical protein [Falsibacillus albus]|uniref:Uncharacterized protein n=1 Tax=Falsibacillus albus TaxID=2478915 RepID=A0A3L7JVS2_9BACI|nr:hypothetical protein [Falsibacillus albus]RLQ94354.1 hypothetical protein D9X91_14985 [Falsibacillus albus]